jgi:hypothetical protein
MISFVRNIGRAPMQRAIVVIRSVVVLMATGCQKNQPG